MKSFECDVAGRKLVMETGKFAGQASASVTVRYGETVVLVTLGIADEPREGVDFLPLTIDYEERLYAAGKIPGGFIRREGRPSEQAILACRLADRPLRPLLPKEWRRDIQIIATVLSADQENDPDILAVIGGSAALLISEVPFYAPVSAVHVGYINGELVLNPTLIELESSQLDLVVASTREAIVMIEAGVKELPEDIIPRAIQFGHDANQDIIKVQEQLQQGCGKPKVEVPKAEINPEVVSAVSSAVDGRLSRILSQPDKTQREQEFSELKRELVGNLGETFSQEEILSVFEDRAKAEVRGSILKGQRLNGRGLTEVRPINCEVGLLPRTHGSGLFSRGQTQVLTIATLGSTRQEQQLDGLGIEETKRFIHHYNFPPFSSGEVKRLGSTNRREIGHGALAERALIPVLPGDEDFPYTIRLVSEVLSSSGSTSMASVCASSLALMDAGIPIKRAVGGIAMGLVTAENDDYVILTDIEGLEDAYGDMDFKIAGTSEGITAIQMDIKLKGVSQEIIKQIIEQSREARLFILQKMQETIGVSRPEVSSYAPRVHKLMIDPEKIGAVIGSGGKTIRSIIEETKTTIDVNNDGTVLIGSPDEEAAQRAITIIENLTKDVEIGEVYTGKVTRLLSFGAFVEILPGKEGMVHISELANYRVPTIEDEVAVGDEITVMVIKNDEGKIGLSRKAVFDKSSRESGAGAGDSGRPPRRYPSEGRPRRPDQAGQRRYDRNAPRSTFRGR
jgi:polyribonucleotide nucleotidyltransferase